ncbi:MAG: S9 family peptidase [Actinomycetota bacterium]|nr:S9 family peptidase [Actinomycetota bacterium]
MDKRPLTPQDLWKLARVGDPLTSPDGGFLVVPVTSYDLDDNEGRTRLWRVFPDGGEPEPLTSVELSSTQPALSPDGRRLAFVRKPPGGDHAQLHVLPLDGGEAQRLTDLPLGVIAARWLPDCRRLVLSAPILADAPTVEGTRQLLEERQQDPVKARVTEDRVYRFWDRWLTDGKLPHLFVVDPGTEELRDLIPESRRWWDWLEGAQHFDVSPDGEEVAFSANSSEPPHQRLRWAIYTVPVEGGEVRCLTPDHPAHDERPRYSPDGRYLVYGMQREWDFYADRVRLVRYDRHREEEEVLTEPWDRSASSWEFTADGKGLLLTAEDRGRVNLYRLGIEGGDPELVAEGGTIGTPRPAGPFVYFRWEDLSRPPEVARCPMEGGKVELVGHFNDSFLEEIEMGQVAEMEVEGSEGRPIQVYLVYPPGFDDSTQWPLVHMIHGGPHGIFGDQFHFRWNAQAFAAPGYLVALVNFHGSTSWGQDFAAVIHGRWGDKPATDVLAATDHLLERGLVDPERMAITGGSYGGYLTAWLASQTDRFATAVCHAGVIDLLAQYASDITQGRARSLGAEPWEDPEAVQRWSPLAHAKGMNTPMLVVHGENDYRVPATQGLELYNVLKAKGVEARLVYYPDENHWVLKPRNSLHWYGEVLGWLERFLKE